MAEYKIMISGVHYGANGDLVAGQKDTPEMHKRTHDLLEWLDRERPIVVIGPDPCNNIHKNAVIACAHGQRIGRVAKNDVDTAWDLLRQSGKTMIIARVDEVIIKDHGYVMVTVDADELKPTPALKSPDSVWQEWMQGLPKLPFSKLLEKEEEAVTILDSLFMPNLEEADKKNLQYYIDLWIEGSHHDLSYEACQKRSDYIRCLETAQDKDIRQLAEPLKEQSRKMCERAPLDEHASVWWKERMASPEVQKLWHDWKLENHNKLWYGLRCIDTKLRLVPGELYNDIAHLDIVLSRLYYLDTPRPAFQGLLALMMLRELTCRELGIEMRPMTEDEYQQDGLITNPHDMPTTIGRVEEFGRTQCLQPIQQQTVQDLCRWLREDYEQSQMPKNGALTGPLATEQAMKYWERLKEQNFVDKRLMLLESTTRQQAMYIAELFAEKMGITTKWKTFEDLWGINNLAQEKQKCTDLGKLPARSDVIDEIFKD